MSKRTARVGHEAPLGYELAGQWKLNLKGWSLVWLFAGLTIIFGLSLCLAFSIAQPEALPGEKLQGLLHLLFS